MARLQYLEVVNHGDRTFPKDRLVGPFPNSHDHVLYMDPECFCSCT